jgi:hypothetical protein
MNFERRRLERHRRKSLEVEARRAESAGSYVPVIMYAGQRLHLYSPVNGKFGMIQALI